MKRSFRTFGALAMSAAALVMISAEVDARRRGSFGSRGARTFDAPVVTKTAPNQVSPVQRTMTEKSSTSAATAQSGARQAQVGQARRGGMGRGLLGGLVAGGLIGALLGYGFGGVGTGLLMALLQVALLSALVWIGLKLFRRRPALAGAQGAAFQPAFAMPEQQRRPAASPSAYAQASAAPTPQQGLHITGSDKEAFERLLLAVQEAFAGEDFGRLRELTTPEVMSYFAEEIGQNATRGLRNSVAGTELMDAEVAEAWSEGQADYATIAMRYESIDVMLDRNTGAVVEGDPTRPTSATELWTFVKEDGGAWRLSAIQDA